MPDGFILAHARGEKVPRSKMRPFAAGSTFNKGSPLLIDANGNYAECGADPAAIAAISEGDVGPTTNPVYGNLGARDFPPGYVVGTLVNNETEYHAAYIGALPAAEGGTYGITKDTDGIWKVDFGKTAASARVKLVDRRWTGSPLNVPRVVVTFLAANVQTA